MMTTFEISAKASTDVEPTACPFEIGEIAVFESYFRFQTYIARVLPIHVEYWGRGLNPIITKATAEQKKDWFKNGESELVIKSLI